MENNRSSLRMKVLISILSVILVVLVVISLVRQDGSDRSKINSSVLTPVVTSGNSPPTAGPTIIVNPTGILRPTNQIAPGEIDVVALDPADGALGVGISHSIVIYFSVPPNMEDIKIFFDPPVERVVTLKGDRVEIVPKSTWAPGITYRYAVNFLSDPMKNRTYTFQVLGPTVPLTEDTLDEEAHEDDANEQRENYPDIYLYNQLPYSTDQFSVAGRFVAAVPAHFAFEVITKSGSPESIRGLFSQWLVSLGFTDEQIARLDVTYK